MLKHLITLGIIAAGVGAGLFIAHKFVLKDGPNDDSGFIEVKPGFGLDDFALWGAVAAPVLGLLIVTKRV